MKAFASIVMVALLAACASAKPEATPSPEATHSKYGTRCPNITTDDDALPHESYAASDIGKPGFPELTARERNVVSKFESQLLKRERGQLRIAWTDGPWGRHHLILFAPSPDQICRESMGLSVLNGTCNEFYIPGEFPDRTIPGTGCYPNDPRPASIPTATP